MRCHFACADDDELVDDHLRAVREVAELRLPERERLRDPRRCSRTRSRARPPRRAGCRTPRSVPAAATRCVERHVLLARLLVDERGVAVAEGAARAVLAREAHGVALDAAACRRRAPRAVPQSIGPSSAIALRAPLEQRDAASGAPGSRAASSPSRSAICASSLDRHRRVGLRLGRGAREAAPGAARLVGLVGPGRPRLDPRERALELRREVLLDARAIVGGCSMPLCDQLLGVELAAPTPCARIFS